MFQWNQWNYSGWIVLVSFHERGVAPLWIELLLISITWKLWPAHLLDRDARSFIHLSVRWMNSFSCMSALGLGDVLKTLKLLRDFFFVPWISKFETIEFNEGYNYYLLCYFVRETMFISFPCDVSHFAVNSFWSLETRMLWCHSFHLIWRVASHLSTFWNFKHKLRQIETSSRKTVFTITAWFVWWISFCK